MSEYIDKSAYIITIHCQPQETQRDVSSDSISINIEMPTNNYAKKLAKNGTFKHFKLRIKENELIHYNTVLILYPYF